jgi:hypothetical protein
MVGAASQRENRAGGDGAMTHVMLRAEELDAAACTVEAVASILMMLANGEHDRGNVPMAMLWLGKQLEQAGMILSDGGKS